MYVRRFLLFITVLTLLMVIGAVLMFQFGGTVLRDSFTPEGQFAPPPASSGPDYSAADSWIARPDIAGNASSWLPGGVTPPPVRGDSAVFYIHPTTYLRGDRWNAPLNERESGDRAELFVQSQSSAFNAAGEIWAPRYRQAAYGAFLLGNDSASKALNLAFQDVSAAFDSFLKAIPPGKPIILAGHSQGALHLIRLLRENRDRLSGRVVAAYVVGWPIDVETDLPALGLPACRSEAQSGCILSWMTFGDPPNPQIILGGWSQAAGLTGGPRSKDRLLCVNPLTGTLGGSAAAGANPGTLVPNGDFTSASLAPAMTGARCDKGLLIAEGDIAPLGPFVLPGNNYHVYDYALFWDAIRNDSKRRLQAWTGR